MEASEQRLRSGRGGKTLARSSGEALRLALLPFAPHHETEGQHDQEGMAMKATPEGLLLKPPASQIIAGECWSCWVAQRHRSLLDSRGTSGGSSENNGFGCPQIGQPVTCR
jgi:hypothetical protein